MERIVAAFWNSCAGLSYALRTERAVRQEAALLVVSVPLAFLVAVNGWQRLLLIGAVVLVISAELLNTCIEKLCDHVTPQLHPQIKAVKDMGSAGVFCVQVLAGVVWLVALAERFGWL
ncbi:diacylglycerol kinase [Roseiarcaceae bacterium H3SJ34-1]|uniref:diacylglycerol kinase n=1 Tax=Terripilifer ovatus TaxID=3032367 RepID=UPI003AB96DA5|nr:diacylglycerol kinase [Roseiarcaceae bacterium H3SJ34-1]